MNHPVWRLFLALMTPFVLLVALIGLSTGTRPIQAAEQVVEDKTKQRELLVVRAYFSDRQMVYELAAWNPPWEVNYDEGYLVIEVTQTEYERLLEVGFRLEVDERLTAELNRVRLPLPQQGGGIPDYACYRTVEETLDSISQMVSTYPTLATSVDIGNSWQKSQGAGGYDLMVLKLTNREIAAPKPKLFAMSSMHAREYAPAELNTRFAEYLLKNYGTNADATWILDHHEIHLLLQANPDGRKWAETGNSWRKNTNNTYCSDSDMRGVDLNRNFEFQWNCCGGSSGNQCALTYHGPAAASEPETQAIQDYMRAEFADQRDEVLTATASITTTGIFIDLHSYSELLLWPWGFDNVTAPNGTALQTLGRKLAYFNDYYPDQAIGLYPTDGTTDDFAYGELGIPAFTFELGTSFFQSCNTFENDILPDNLAALLYAAKVARTPYITPAAPDVVGLSLAQSSILAGQLVTLTATLNDSRFNDRHGVEATQPITAAEYYIDVPPWVTTTLPIAYPISAADGTFDSPIENITATLDTTELTVGRHTIFVRGQDGGGHWGAVSALFLELTDKSPQLFYLPMIQR